jgi:hypothetical protein
MPRNGQGVPQAKRFQWLLQVACINTAVELAQLSRGRQATCLAINGRVRARENHLFAHVHYPRVNPPPNTALSIIVT